MEHTNLAVRSILPVLITLSELIFEFATEMLNIMSLTLSEVVAHYIPTSGYLFEFTRVVLDWLINVLNIGDVTLLSLTFGYVAILFIVDLVKKFL